MIDKFYDMLLDVLTSGHQNRAIGKVLAIVLSTSSSANEALQFMQGALFCIQFLFFYLGLGRWFILFGSNALLIRDSDHEPLKSMTNLKTCEPLCQGQHKGFSRMRENPGLIFFGVLSSKFFRLGLRSDLTETETATKICTGLGIGDRKTGIGRNIGDFIFRQISSSVWKIRKLFFGLDQFFLVGVHFAAVLHQAEVELRRQWSIPC